MDSFTRRDVFRAGAGIAIAAAAAARPEAAAVRQGAGSGAARREFCFFSKHLAELDWKDLGKAVKDAGFDGVDLTVRAGGHVLPERADDLPKAIEAIRAAGVSVPMITTELTSPAHPTAKPILQAAARSGVRYFKTGYWRYTASPDVRGQLAATGEALTGLTALARECGIELGFHNHNAYIGAALWDIAPAMDRLDPKWAGYYFDPRHAVAEGGGGAYKAATHLVAAAPQDDRAQGFLLGEVREGLAHRELSDGRGDGGLGVVRDRAQERDVRGADLAPFRVRDPRRDARGARQAHACRGREGPGCFEKSARLNRVVRRDRRHSSESMP